MAYNIEELKQILLDKENGAADLLRGAVDWLNENPESLSLNDADKTLRLLRRTRPAMAGFSVLARRIENAWRQNPDRDPENILKVIKTTLNEADAEVAELFGEILKGRGRVSVVTLSNSSTVISCLEHNRSKVKSLQVLESRPGGEGRVLAERCREFIDEVIVRPDEEMKDVVSQVDIGIMGADTVFADGAVLNKVLSAKLAQLLRDRDKPVYVLASSWKQSDRRSDEKVTAPETIFELVPSEYITDVISEK